MPRPFQQIKTILISAAFLWFSTSWMAGLAQPPNLRPHVTDQAELLSAQTRSVLEKILSDFEEATTHEIFVATFPTLGDETMEAFGNRLADEWKIGYKDLANGAIFIIFKKEHQAWLEVGSGLERRLPFPFRKELIDRELAPYFRSHQYDAGVFKAVKKIVQKVDPLYYVPRGNPEKSAPLWKKLLFGFVFIFLFTLLFDVISYRVYLNEILEHPQSAYQKRIGKYSFLEWWLIYGLLTTVFEYAYYRLFIFWFNPGWSITSRGAGRVLLAGKTGRGRFWGNGISGRW